jgi:hypothetical protein
MSDLDSLRRTIGRHAHNAHYLSGIDGGCVTTTV